MLSKTETLEALQAIAMMQKDYADSLERFETYTGIQLIGKFERNGLQVFSGLVESGIDLEQTARINSNGTVCEDYPTEYSITVGGIRFFELSKDEPREGEANEES